MQDFYVHQDFVFEPIETFYLGAIVLEDDRTIWTSEIVETTWQTWDYPTYHMRLKRSYFIVKEAFQRGFDND